jgi:hypothetical protein
VGVRADEYSGVDKSRIQRARVATVAKGTADMSSVEKMREVMEQSDDPVVIAEAVRGIGHVRDAESLPKVLDLMDHPDEKVQEATFYTAERLIGVRPVSKNNRAKFYRDFYKHMQKRD